ncbi:MAG: Gfo/Idh/MocA family oxidoreductase [Eubacteriales bacterium]
MTQNKKVGVGILGGGFIAEKHAVATMQIENAELIAICDTNADKALEFSLEYDCKAYIDFEQFLADKEIDLVLVCIPSFLHKEYVIKAANANKHILCEKPFAIKSEECQEMIESAKKNNVILAVAQVLRFWPAYEKIYQMIHSGMIGHVKTLKATRLSQLPTWSQWYRDPAKSGGALYDLQIHDIDYIHYLAKSSVETMSAIGVKDDNNAWNEVITNLTMENGMIANIHVTNQLNCEYPFTMSFFARGDKGAIEFLYTDGINIGMSEQQKSRFTLFVEGKEPEEIVCSMDDGYKPQLAYMVDCVLKNQRVEKVPIEQSLEIIKLVENIQAVLENN